MAVCILSDACISSEPERLATDLRGALGRGIQSAPLRKRAANTRTQLLQRGKQLLPLRLFHGQQNAQQRHPVARGIGCSKLPDKRLVLRILQKRQHLSQKAARTQIGRTQNTVRFIRHALPQEQQRLVLLHRAKLQIPRSGCEMVGSRRSALVDRIRNTP